MERDLSTEDCERIIDDNEDRIDETYEKTWLRRDQACLLLCVQKGSRQKEAKEAVDTTNSLTRTRIARKRAWNTVHFLTGNRFGFLSLTPEQYDRMEPVPFGEDRTNEHLDRVNPEFLRSVATVSRLKAGGVEVAYLWLRGEKLADVKKHINSDKVYYYMQKWPARMARSKNTLDVCRCRYDELRDVEEDYSEEAFAEAGIPRTKARGYTNVFTDTQV